MKIDLIRKVTIGCFMFLLFAVQFAAAQTQPVDNHDNKVQSDRAAETVVETMGDDDRLPFMHEEHPALSTSESSSGNLMLKTLGAMLLIVGLIFFGAWGFKKFGANLGLLQPRNSAKTDAPELAILNSITLGNGRTLNVIKFGERNLLVGSTAQNFTLLAAESFGAQTILSQNRSVADLLAEENELFADELNAADLRLNFCSNKQS